MNSSSTPPGVAIAPIPIWNPSFSMAFAANFLMMFAFYLLMPTLPFYLTDTFSTTPGVTGIVMSVYIVAALAIRPFSGYFLDNFDRKKLYLLAFLLFTLLFAGYPFAHLLWVFVVLRILHGFTFGATTTAGNTIAIDILPPLRRAEGIGYYGMSTNLAMAIGPTAGLLVMEKLPYSVLFWFAFVVSATGFLLSLRFKVPHKPATHVQPLTLDRFVLKKALPLGFNLLLIALSYGLIISFGAVFGKEIGVLQTGWFFTLMAAGIFAARLLSGKFLNKGYFKTILSWSMVLLTSGYATLAITHTPWLYFLVAVVLGVGFGMLTPATQTMAIQLGTHQQRGTANSTYFTAFDLGVGGGMLLGGKISGLWGLHAAFAVVAILNLVAWAGWILYTYPHFLQHRTDVLK